jgi:soluble lytic murein transglycosylase
MSEAGPTSGGRVMSTKSRTYLVAAVLVLIATWVACSGGSPFGRLSPEDRAETGSAGERGDLEEGLLDLSDIVPARPTLPSAEARTEGARILREALRTAAAGEPGAAAEFDRAARLLPAFADWIHVMAARNTTDTAEVRRLVARVGDGGAAEWAWRAEYDALLLAGDTVAAIGTAEGAAARTATAAERAQAWSRSAILRAARRDAAGALRAVRESLQAGPGSPGGLAAARIGHDLPGLTPDDRLAIGRALLTHGGTDRAVPMLEAYATAPGTPVEAGAEVMLSAGRVLFNARRYDAAERALRRAAVLPEGALLLARTQYRQGRRDQGLEGFAALSRTHPTSTPAAEGLFLLGDLAHDAGRLSSAAEYYRQAIATGVHSVPVTDATVRLVGISLTAGDPRTALRDLDAYLAARPRDRISAPAVYWLGRARLALGEGDAARDHFREVLELDPISYYGMLAASRLGTSLGSAPLPDPPALDAGVAEAIEYAFFRIDLLRELDFGSDADLELARLQEAVSRDHTALYYVAEALSLHGQPIAGALLGRQIQQARGIWDERLLRIVFQFPYRELVVRESVRQGLDPYAVAGLIRQESFFNPVAVSPAGAVGLMQVMPQTATGLARRGGISNFQASMLRDPAVNVRLGTLYLADQTNRWGGRLSDVYAAYNAGPNRVARWRQYPEHRDDDVYVERIPIAETRDYVKRVRLNGEIYRRLYGGE